MELRGFKVYIIGPYTGKDEGEIDRNVNNAMEWADRVWLTGMTAVCPHLNSGRAEKRFDLAQEQYYIGYNSVLIGCDAGLILPNSDKSKGAKGEIKKAGENGIALFKTTDFPDLLEYAKEYVKKETVFKSKGMDLLEYNYVIPMLGALLKSQVKDKGADSWKTRLSVGSCLKKIHNHWEQYGRYFLGEKSIVSDHGFPHSVSIVADAMFLAWHELNDNPELKKQIKKKMDEIYG
jgi:hypothetical protein